MTCIHLPLSYNKYDTVRKYAVYLLIVTTDFLLLRWPSPHVMAVAACCSLLCTPVQFISRLRRTSTVDTLEALQSWDISLISLEEIYQCIRTLTAELLIVCWREKIIIVRRPFIRRLLLEVFIKISLFTHCYHMDECCFCIGALHGSLT